MVKVDGEIHPVGLAWGVVARVRVIIVNPVAFRYAV